MAGVGNRAGEPLIQVMLGFLAEYLAIAVTAVAAYVFAMGGGSLGRRMSAQQKRPPLTFSSKPSMALSRKKLS